MLLGFRGTDPAAVKVDKQVAVLCVFDFQFIDAGGRRPVYPVFATTTSLRCAC